jgi:hypothetical protein
MTPKEKAEQLFGKFADIEHLGVYGNYNGTWEWSSSLWRKQAKESAIIAVDEIMYNNLMEYPQHSIIYAPHKNDYWQQVKHEIEKL